MKRILCKKVLLGSLAALLLALPVAAAPSQPVAEVENQGDTLIFHPVAEFAKLVLTATGPCGFDYRQEVTKGEPFIRIDATMIDGFYRYNLFREERIDPEIIEVLLDARQNNDPETPKALCRDGKLPGPPVNQSEGFHVVEGRFLYDRESVEKALRDRSDGAAGGFTPALSGGFTPARSAVPTKDFVILDDLIVDGSACIGFDCVNGESFGFDTIRVKENNLRIKFDDTSVAASFPRNDWQLTANDSANGGASKFSIDDISGGRTPFTVEANARSHSLYVDDGGRIGSRTSTPSTEMHTVDGDTPTLRLQQDGSSGFAPQTWDVAGNETNFFIRDVTNGSALPFRIRPGAPTSAIDIASDGDVGIGTASPDAELHVEDTVDDAQIKMTGNGGFTGFIVENTSATAADSWQVTHGAGGALAIDDTDGVNGAGGTQEFRIFNDGDVTISGTLTEGSSVHGKENFVTVDPQEVLEQVLGLPITTWNYKTDDPAVRHMGPMAQDFFAVFELGDTDRGIATRNLSAVALAAIKGLHQELQTKDQQVEDLQQRLMALEEMLADR